MLYHHCVSSTSTIANTSTITSTINITITVTATGVTAINIIGTVPGADEAAQDKGVPGGEGFRHGGEMERVRYRSAELVSDYLSCIQVDILGPR